MELPSNSNINQLNISINVLGDIDFKITKFLPKMIYPSSLQNAVLFVPNVRITLDTLIKSNVAIKKTKYKPSDFVNVFSNPNLLNKVIRYIKQKSNFKPTSIKEAERKGYIKDNIDLILSIYFADDNQILINNKKYPLHSYEWNGEYKTVKSNQNITNYNIDLDLYVLNQNKSGDISQKRALTCDIKRRKIALDLKELGFNVNIPIVGEKEIPSYGPSIRGPYNYQPTFRNQSRYRNRQTPYNYSYRPPISTSRRAYTIRRGGRKKNKSLKKK